MVDGHTHPVWAGKHCIDVYDHIIVCNWVWLMDTPIQFGQVSIVLTYMTILYSVTGFGRRTDIRKVWAGLQYIDIHGHNM